MDAAGGIGSARVHAGRGGSAAGTVWDARALSPSFLLFFSRSAGGRARGLTSRSFLLFSTDPVDTPFVCREATGAGMAATAAFYLWVFLVLPAPKAFYSSFLRETMTIPPRGSFPGGTTNV
jgi:hypothetical protein